jgi:hypothetical protein
MKSLSIMVTALAFIMVAACPADARPKDHPNFGYCKSGNAVGDIKYCKENGGRR